MSKVQTSAVIAGQSFELDRDDIDRAARGLMPEPIRTHFVVVNGTRFPPKQIIAAVSGVDRNDFTTNQARAILRRLGFVLGRVPAASVTATVAESAPVYRSQEAENLRPYIGRWVAVDGIEVVVAADSPEDVYQWLVRHDRTGSIFRVPVDPSADIGALDA